jgi:hypothetical protein
VVTLSSSYRFVERLLAGHQHARLRVRLAAPRTPGRHFIVTAAGLETDAAYLFSGTNWVVGRPIWGDGNDIARWPAESILQAIRSGRARPWKVFLISDSGGRRVESRPEMLGANALQIDVRGSR